MNSAPLGIFDSGSGGLSIVESIQAHLPHESIVYVGDHANNPYGNKSQDFIRRRVVAIIEYLLSRGAKMIVAACNTATIAGIDYYREKFPNVPIIGVVPVIKTAATLTKRKTFVVLSTDFTARSEYQKNLIEQWAGECEVINIGSSQLVPLIEEGQTAGAEVEKEIQDIFKSIPPSFDVVALGCTHFPFVKDTLQKIVGPQVQIIDAAEAVTRQVERILDHNNIRSEGHATEEFLTTAQGSKISEIFTILLKRKVSVAHVAL